MAAGKALSLEKLGLAACVLLILSPIFLQPAYAQNEAIVFTTNFQVSGQHSASTGVIDICATVQRGNCPFSITISESFADSVVSKTSIPVLLLGNGSEVTSDITPSSPQVSVSAVFSAGNSTYPLNLPIPAYPLSSKFSTPSACVPISVILDALGLPVPPLASALSLCVDLEFSTSLEELLGGTGVLQNSILTWNALAPASSALAISNSSSTVAFNESMSFEQDISLGLSVETTAPEITIGSTSLPLNAQTYSSQTDFLSSWYRVQIDKPDGGTVQPVPGVYWRAPSYPLTLSATPDSTHQFQQWYVNGLASSNSTSFQYSLNAPAEIRAVFVISTATVVGSILAVIVLSIALILTYYYMHRREDGYDAL